MSFPLREYKQGDYTISTDKSRLDLDVIHGYLSRSYWATNIPREVVQKGVENSLCFGLYHGQTQIGLARIITDYATFAYLSDVFVLEEYRAQGLGKWLVGCVVTDPDLGKFRQWLLLTRDAQLLYSRFGFAEPKPPVSAMTKPNLDAYKPQE